MSAAEIAAGLRTLAHAVEDHPELTEGLAYGVSHIHVVDSSQPDTAAWLGRIARIAARCGWRVEKNATDVLYNLDIRVNDSVKLKAIAFRNEVCEATVVGTKTIEIPDPDAPKITVERDIVEWKCKPILASLDGAS